MGSASTKPSTQSPLRYLDADQVSSYARKESRSRDSYLPPVSTFRWWARRTEAVNGALIDAYTEQSEDGAQTIVDPFAGGGTIALAAVRRGCQIYAQDINPWAALGLWSTLSLPEPEPLMQSFRDVKDAIEDTIRDAYRTELSDGRPAWITHTFRVATVECPRCDVFRRLFPHAVVSLKERKDSAASGTEAFLACPRGHLVEGDYDKDRSCPDCELTIDPDAQYTAGRRATCPTCGEEYPLKDLVSDGNWKWEVVLVERRADGTRELSKPTSAEIGQASDSHWTPELTLPAIRPGDETAVLLRYGFHSWHDLYPDRQRVVLESLLDEVETNIGSNRHEHAIRLAALGTAEMAGMISRWDRWYLKSYEGMANHRFNVTTFTAEPNVWGPNRTGRGTFVSRIQQLRRASEWMREEVGASLSVEGPYRLSDDPGPMSAHCDARIVEGSSHRLLIPDNSAGLVLTDPPYHDDVQYDELSLLFRAWAGLSTSQLTNEAVIPESLPKSDRDGRYRNLLNKVFNEVNRVLEPGGHLIFTYANRDLDAWIDVIAALIKADMTVIGYEVLHSDNETDFSKRGVKACNLDLVVDAVAASNDTVNLYEPSRQPRSKEERFLFTVGSNLLGVEKADSWESRLRNEVAGSEFLE